MTVPMIPTLINGMWELELPEHRAERPQWSLENGGWEKERLIAMYASIGEGDLVYDIGAEEGDMPALWASWGADVVLVEPNPLVWPNIRCIFEGNSLVDNVRGYHVGFAGDIPGENPEWDAEHVGVGTWPKCAYGPVIPDHGFLHLVERPEVPITTIDALAAEHGAPTHITIDVEGSELMVLRGAENTLRDARPVVFASLHTDAPWMAEKYPDGGGEHVNAFMTSLGYEAIHLATDHEIHMEYRPL